MLRLASATDPSWAERAAAAMDVVLLDHCHLEKKAASTALTLIFRYPEHPRLARPLSELAREELEHFELVLGHLERRGVPFGRLRPAPYAGKLMKVVREAEPERLLDTLLACALIEARSCERMKLLAEALEDAELSALYRGLLASEARHHGLYYELARDIFGREVADARLREVAAHEAKVVAEAPREPRLHNG
jgi:tRNA-(ms[2]io[6]A)-hydroxylase